MRNVTFQIAFLLLVATQLLAGDVFTYDDNTFDEYTIQTMYDATIDNTLMVGNYGVTWAIYALAADTAIYADASYWTINAFASWDQAVVASAGESTISAFASYNVAGHFSVHDPNPPVDAPPYTAIYADGDVYSTGIFHGDGSGLSNLDFSTLGSAAHAETTDFATAVEGQLANDAVQADGTTPLTGDLDADGHTITDLASPAAATDAATRGYVDTNAGDVFTTSNNVFAAGTTQTMDHAVISSTLAVGASALMTSAVSAQGDFDVVVAYALYDRAINAAAGREAVYAYASEDMAVHARANNIAGYFSISEGDPPVGVPANTAIFAEGDIRATGDIHVDGSIICNGSSLGEAGGDLLMGCYTNRP